MLKWTTCWWADVAPIEDCNFGCQNLGRYGTKSIYGRYLGACPFFFKAPSARALPSIPATFLCVIALLEIALFGSSSSLKYCSTSSSLLTTCCSNLSARSRRWANLFTILLYHMTKVWTFIYFSVTLLIIIFHKHRILVDIQWWKGSRASTALYTLHEWGLIATAITLDQHFIKVPKPSRGLESSSLGSSHASSPWSPPWWCTWAVNPVSHIDRGENWLFSLTTKFWVIWREGVFAFIISWLMAL